jgi:predicted ATPase
MCKGLDDQRAIGTQEDFPIYFEMLAEAYGLAGRIEQGKALLDEALTLVDQNDQRFWEAEIHRRYGELLVLDPNAEPEQAAARFRKAMTIAVQQKAKSLELRAAMSLARLARRRGDIDGALQVLAPVHDWFVEGFDTRDLQEAAALRKALEAAAPLGTARDRRPVQGDAAHGA